MFGLASGLYQSYFSPTQLNILLIGEEGVGKTAFLERIKVTHFAHKREVIWNERRSLRPPKTAAAASAAVVTTTSSHDGSKQNATTKRMKKAKQGGMTTFSHPNAMMSSRRSLVRRIACPAPPRYHQAAYVQEEEEEDDEYDEEEACDTSEATESTFNSTMGPPPPPFPSPLPIADRRTSQESMESVDINTGANETTEQESTAHETVSSAATASNQLQPLVVPEKQYDVKPNAKMLPLDKIRPTSGMNLAKVEVCGCKCHVWDLCGRFQSLWERYYGDCDAVIFVVHVQDILHPAAKQRPTTTTTNNGGGGKALTDEDKKTPSSTTLEKVRSSIADDVPFLILGHVGQSPQSSFNDAVMPDVMYSTESLLPHYHNPMTAMFMANAATGQGVKSAMEWLVPLAKRQKPLRDTSSTGDVNDGINK